jgi:hypothetical protein
MSVPFAILGTPRSRTAWFAKFLSYEQSICEHEPSRNWSSVEDITRYFIPDVGASDSMLTLRWRDILKVPNIKVIVIKRPVEDVICSARKAGLGLGYFNILRISASIAEIAREQQDIPIVAYKDLTAEVCANIFSYILEKTCPFDWLEKWLNTHVLADVQKIHAEAQLNERGLRVFYGG